MNGSPPRLRAEGEKLQYVEFAKFIECLQKFQSSCNPGGCHAAGLTQYCEGGKLVAFDASGKHKYRVIRSLRLFLFELRM